MSRQFESNVLDLWFEGSHQADRREHGAEAKSKSVTNRDQVMAVVQVLEATGTSPTARPINEVARDFLLSSPKQNALIPPSPAPNAGTLRNSTQNTAIGEAGRYSTENADSRVEVSIRRHSNSSECDVIVAIRDREMVLRLPDYGRALKWAQMESRSYRLPAVVAEEAPSLRARENDG
jgi:hypothetical protein